MATQKKSTKLTVEQFVFKAIESLRTGTYKGIHVRFSGFNEAYREAFAQGLLDTDIENPIDATNKLAEAGKIVIRPVRGGVMLYKSDEAPNTANLQAKKTLAAILG